MKIKNIILGLGAAATFAVSCNQTPSVTKVELKNETDSISYAVGFLNAEGMKQQLLGSFDTIDTKVLATAFVNAEFSKQMKNSLSQSFDSISFDLMKTGFINTMIGEKNPTFEQATANGFLQEKFQKAQAAKQQLKAQAGPMNKVQGEAFLAENKAKEGVKTLESGLQYEVLVEGTGVKPTLEQKVKCHYHGTLIDGKEFDSSLDGEPATFSVNGVIPGWTEALQLMPVGSKWKLCIPSALAYGPRGAGQDIGPDATLIFEVELLEIVEE